MVEEDSRGDEAEEIVKEIRSMRRAIAFPLMACEATGL